MATHLIFVYGTLKKGFGNHRLLATSKFLGKATTLPKYKLYSLGSFPGLVAEENGVSVIGELYEVDEIVLASLDRLEGVPYMYKRKEIELIDPPSTKIEAYFYNLRDSCGMGECGTEWK